jgi:hypothetical protein
MSHWLKIDHITFLLMLPLLLLSIAILHYPVFGESPLFAEICIATAILLWSMALVYDLWEHQQEKKHIIKKPVDYDFSHLCAPCPDKHLWPDCDHAGCPFIVTDDYETGGSE